VWTEQGQGLRTGSERKERNWQKFHAAEGTVLRFCAGGDVFEKGTG